MLSALRSFDLRMISIYLIAVLLSMSLHEMAHGLMAYWMGDATAKSRGRVSLNPFAHIDWLGLLCLLLFGFGWAKPVPVDPSRYKDPKAGMVWTAFAGPMMNFILSFVCVLLFEVLVIFSGSFTSTAVGSYLISLLSSTAIMSAGFGLFNLIPIPPLDGARIFWAFLPDDMYFRVNNPPAWVNFLFLIVIFSGLLSSPLASMRSTLIGWMESGALWLLRPFF
ncbi:site-2 protease family protein [Allobaculum mucilyticum]|uniref:site-2 protease family protein n=1 Tax=Allobaculum mucilyticum TaxID=2834459 RepID=UPI001E3CD29A|nr:site-2 protease family protein [Allobaculum mucilyticum]